MSSDGFADITIEFDQVALMEHLNLMQCYPVDVRWEDVLNGTASDKDTEYAREMFNEFVLDFTNVDYDYSTMNFDDDALVVWRSGAISSYAEIKSSLFEKELKKFFDKYKSFITVVDIVEELQIDGLGLYKIENRKEDGKHFLVHSASTITYEDFTAL